MKKLPAVFLLYMIIISAAFSENFIVDNFSRYGIKNIGIYTEAYEDSRSNNFVFEVAAIRANGIIQNPRLFRYRYCNYDLVTPPLTSITYPLGKSASENIDKVLEVQIEKSLVNLGWQTELIENTEAGELSTLLENSAAGRIDAVLIARYTPITYILPIENYKERIGASGSSADTGKIMKGRGLVPALELYDTETGTRLWYSAYLTGHQRLSKKMSFEESVKAIEMLFVHTDEDADIKAVDKMLQLTLNSEEAPFPRASDSGKIRTATSAGSRLKRLLWFEHPSFAFYGTQVGIGYSLDYIGDYDILYKDSFEGNYPGNTPVENAGIIENAMMHRFHIPFYSLAAHNISLEPSFFFGLMPPTGANVSYTDIEDDHHDGYNEEALDDAVNTTITALGLDLSLKYHLRFADNFAAFIGGRGNVALWFQQAESIYNPANSNGFIPSYESLFFEDNTGLAINASIIAGLRWESNTPFELFGELTPIGPGTGMMFSAGIRYIPFTYGFVDPHATNISTGTKGF